MRNVLSIPFDGMDSLIIASDNSGAIGMKNGDLVVVPYETVAYYSFRVAVMECIAAGGEPISVVLSNFCGNDAWEELAKGIRKGLNELQIKNVSITGSSESNFSLQQSAISIMVLGKKIDNKRLENTFSIRKRMAVIGEPLVGNEVIEKAEQIAQLTIFDKISRMSGVIVWPVGSKGILFELNQMFPNSNFSQDKVFTEVDVLKSSGPATCFIALYEAEGEEELKTETKGFFHPIQVMN